MVGIYPHLVKEFAVYTLLRLVLLAGSFAMVAGIWLAVADEVPLLWVLVIAFVVSGVASYFILNRPRERFDPARFVAVAIDELLHPPLEPALVH